MYDIVGDVHGCFQEFKHLTARMDYEWKNGLPFHEDGRKLIFAGDITDRGPDSVAMIETVSGIVKRCGGLYVPGNHCNKLYRYMIGRPVRVAHGLETTVQELDVLAEKERRRIFQIFIDLYEHSPFRLILDHRNLVVCHAGIREEDIDSPIDKKIRSFILYGDTTGRRDEHGLPERRDWAKYYHGSALIVYGHTPVKKPRWKNRTLNLDTGCVFGGALSALRYPEQQIISVPSSMPVMAERFIVFPE